MRAETFADKYSMSKDNLYVAIHHKKMPKLSHRFDDTHRLYINEKWFIKRQNFKKRIYLESHDYYYWLAEHFIDFDISKLLAERYGNKDTNWTTFLTHSLFARPSPSITDLRIAQQVLQFHRFSSHLFRRLTKRKKNAKISVILDRRI